ncbi:MAG TPA: MFS transporter [Acidimicrobiia bacterium]
MSVAVLVRRPAYRALLTGQSVSAIGDWMATVAFMVLVLEVTGSPLAVGGILTLRLLPAAIGGPLAARAAHRWDRRRTMLAMDAVRAAMVAVVPFVRGLWWIYLWAFLLEVASLVFLPARDASIPDLVDDDQLPLANGLVLGSSYGSIPIGAAMFAAVAALPFADLAGRPLALVFWVDALTFLVSFAFLSRLTNLGSPPALTGEESVGLRGAFAIPLVRAVMPAAAAVALGLGALFSLGIVFVRDVLDAGDVGFGLLIALFGVGAAGGVAVLQRQHATDSLVTTRLGVATIGVIVALFSLAPALWVAFLGAVAFGAAAAYTLASAMSAVQSRLDGQQRVLAFAAFHVVIRVALGLAAVGAGVAGDLLGSVRWPVVGRLEPSRMVLLCSGLLVLVSALLVQERHVRSAASDTVEPGSEGRA